jgi:hypothetical protein
MTLMDEVSKLNYNSKEAFCFDDYRTSFANDYSAEVQTGIGNCRQTFAATT